MSTLDVPSPGEHVIDPHAQTSMGVADAVRSARLERGWSIEEAAAHAGIPVTAMEEVEAGILPVGAVRLLAALRGLGMGVRIAVIE